MTHHQIRAASSRHGFACIVTLLAASLIGCGPSGNAPGPKQEAKPKIGLLMDTLVKGERWERDRDLFLERTDQLGTEVLVESADAQGGQLQQAESLLERGVQVLVVVPHNAEDAGQIVAAAKKRSVPVISYDRLILNADVDFYLSYDNKMVGAQQAQFLRNRAPKGNYILLGGAPTDHNAKLIREGQMAVLEDAIKSGDIKIVADPWVPNWQAEPARSQTEAALKKARNQVVAVVASNDVTAGGAIEALQKAGLAGKTLVSGQDANLGAVHRILNGTQTMTVYKPLRTLARQAAQVAVQMAKGEKVEGSATVNNGTKDVPAVLFTPVTIHKDLIPILVNDRFYTQAQIDGAGGSK